MGDSILVQYLGSEAKTFSRESGFVVCKEHCELRDFMLTLTNRAFPSRSTRYEDVPDIRLLKPARIRDCSSNGELADYDATIRKICHETTKRVDSSELSS